MIKNEIIQPLDHAFCASIAKAKHQLRQREGHHTPDWDSLSDLMRTELIYREMLLQLSDRGISFNDP